MHGHSVKFIIGMVFLLTNQVIGWAGLIVGAWLGKKTGKKAYYALGTVTYGLSWGMVAAGVYLAGPEGLALVKVLFRKYMWQTICAAAVIAAGALVYYLLKKRKK
jgi:hypothetical protein